MMGAMTRLAVVAVVRTVVRVVTPDVGFWVVVVNTLAVVGVSVGAAVVGVVEPVSSNVVGVVVVVVSAFLPPPPHAAANTATHDATAKIRLDRDRLINCPPL